ncbi:transmembrane protein 47-like isoform X2 [Mercenaria mercenaria]|uniref:transmembrane protein 47-like isoform X2 n=1 Tax=Mercenaria mercenaria TaxID=6596 RepID=UPI00234E8B6F|nr:transmembrane protein 47-like isoform X2 [Mercenaria mercenaria]
MEASCAQILGLIMLVNTNLAIIISFATPYWRLRPLGFGNDGLWAECAGEECRWVFDDEFYLQKTLPDWFKATQGLMSVGLGLGLIALLVATLSLCCTCHSCNPHHPICGLLLTSCISMAVGIVIFGVKAHDDWGIELEKGLYGSFGWSFWVGIGATAMAFLTACIYCCMGRKRH